MEKESYQPSAEEMEKAQEMADAIQNERGEGMMTEEQEERSEDRRKELIETKIDAQLIENLEGEGLKLKDDSTEVVVYLKDGSHIKGVHEGLYNMYDYVLFKTKSDSKIFSENKNDDWVGWSFGGFVAQVDRVQKQKPEKDHILTVIPKDEIDHIVNIEK